MTEQEKINAEVQMRLANHDEKFNSFMNSMDDFKREMADFKNEMRDRDNRRAEEIAEIRADIKEIYKATDAKITDIKNSVDSMSKHVQTLSITAMGGIIAAGVGIAAMVIAVLLK